MTKSKLSLKRNYGTTVSLNAANNNAITKVILVITNLVKLVQSIPINGARRDDNNYYSSQGERSELTPREYYLNLFVSMLLVLAGGVFAGLTLGLMGQDEVYLKVISTSGDRNERKYAKKVLSLIGRGKHWVLVTLLLSNVITNETLPIVLDRCLGGGWPAVVTSTVSIVIFGEIIPQSICVRYGLQVGALFAPFVLVLMYIMYPVAFPCAMLLDHILGEDHGTVYKKSGLKTLVTLHKTMGVERLNQDEVTIISAVLDLKEKSVSSIMTPMDRVYTMSADTLLDEKTVEEIFNAGFSRIPIHLPKEPNNFIGMLLVRVLISYDPEDALPVASFPLATLPETGVDTSCLNILNYFQEGKSHMIIVSETPGEPTGALGVLTLEDVIEELIGEEIVDESDVYIDINKNIKRKHPGPLSKRNLTAYLHSLYQRSGDAPSNRNSLESAEPPADLRERLIGHNGEATIISSTPNNCNSKNDTVAEARTGGGGGGGGHGVPSGTTTKWKIKNPALNPLETSKKFVTIKRPDQGAIDSFTKAVSPTPNHSDHVEREPSQQIGEVFPTEQGAIDEAQRRSSEMKSPSPLSPQYHFHHYHQQHHHHQQHHQHHQQQKEADVSEIQGGESYYHTGDHGAISIPSRKSDLIQGPGSEGALDIEHQESRSYRTGGIIESVVNVDGVHKTIIENVSDGDDGDEDDDQLLVDGTVSSKDKHKKKKKKKTTTMMMKKNGKHKTKRAESFSMNKMSDEESEESRPLLNGSGSKHSSISSATSKRKSSVTTGRNKQPIGK
ncbi:MAM3 [Candida oxycetoniae]|uniref:MAM3 n=1 Tax=Candida oxycetoniae TaxID=497107 RepID=A0AAI9SWA2_9ASCO|nr:MAM3 [Candida oxycetoniae]KAI3404268.2 MAM3 [Candida oxycetoniae]